MTKIYTIKHSTKGGLNVYDVVNIKKAIYKHASVPNLSNGWKFEIYLTDNNILVSEPMTNNSWSEDSEKVGSFDYFDINDFEGVGLVRTSYGTYTDYLEIREGDYDEELHNKLIEEYGKNNIVFRYDDKKPILMKENDYLDYIVDESELPDLDTIIEEIDKRLDK